VAGIRIALIGRFPSVKCRFNLDLLSWKKNLKLEVVFLVHMQTNTTKERKKERKKEKRRKERKKQSYLNNLRSWLFLRKLQQAEDSQLFESEIHFR
jgi:hypothetical protein